MSYLGQTNRETTKYGPNFVFDPNDRCVIYSADGRGGTSVPAELQNAGYILPTQAGKPLAWGKYYYDINKGPCPWPGTGTAPSSVNYINNRWVCDPNQKPKDISSGEQYYCCPTGWSKSILSDPMPCRNSQDLYDCGPLPAGVDKTSYVCCNRTGEWYIKKAGTDPCKLLKSADILPVNYKIKQEPVLSKNMIIFGAIAVLIVIVSTVLV